MNTYNNIPGIDTQGGFINPTLTSPNTPFELPFYQTRESLLDVQVYERFLNNAISRFRHSRTYKNHKGYLINLGLDRCQFHGNITNEMATIEMHHNMLTIFDIAVIITEHMLNTYGYITTFDLVNLLKKEHKNNRIQLVMLSLTSHQLYHNSQDFFIHPDMCFGNWQSFLEEYHDGITQDIAYKILYYLNRSIDEGESNDNGLLDLREKIYDWSVENGCD